ncbi:hypothetical protein QQ045_017713 [Rhodiola kirilowii]
MQNDKKTKTAYFRKEADLQGEPSDKNKISLFWKKFWRVKTQNKAKIFMWKLYHNVVPVAANLIKRGCSVEAKCIVCGCKVEDAIHVFLKCWWAKDFWMRLMSSAGFLSINFNSLADWIWFCYRELDGEELSKVFCGARWIWWNRNRLWHDEEGADLTTAVLQVKGMVKEIHRKGFRFIYSNPEAGDRWFPPEFGRYKISCDGAWNPLSKEAGVGIECRGCEGKIEFVEAFPLGNHANILGVEGLALKRGMELALERNLSKVTFVSDSVEVITALISNPFRLKGEAWLEACSRMMEENNQWTLEHALRGANRVADLLAQKAREHRWSWRHPSAIPLFLSSVVS